MSADSRCHIELVLKANHVQVTNEQHSCGLLTQEMVSDSSSQSYVMLETFCKKSLSCMGPFDTYEAFCDARRLSPCQRHFVTWKPGSPVT